MRFPGFSGEWTETTIGNVADVIGGGTPDTTVSSYWDGDTAWFTPTEIGQKKYVGRSKRTISEKGLGNSSAKLLPVGAILLTTRATIGEASIALNACTTNQGFQSLISKPNIDNEFLYYLISTKKKDLFEKACGSTFMEISANEVRKIRIKTPTKQEQVRIAKFLAIVDDRMETQIVAIEDYKKLKGYLIDKLIAQQGCTMKIRDIILQRAERNRKGDDYTVLSVSNQKGFIAQSEQFEEREVASEDKSNYKIVRHDDFAYNPARINVGSIARLSNYDCGIVSPMYICFHANERVLPEFLGYFFESSYFATEVEKRLEGSVRLCLSYESLCDIPIQIPDNEKQRVIIQKLDAISQKIVLEEQCLDLFKQQKAYLLKNMFV